MKQWLILVIIAGLSGMLSAQNIGIDVSSPTQKLDVNGRVRIQKAGVPGRMATSTAGINSLIFGNLDDNTVGISSQSGWRMVMDANNGRVGINTIVPSTTLDLNASLRIRGSALAGATLTSMDANGSAQWVGPAAFRVSGTLNSANFTITAPYYNPQKLFFYNIEYNSGGVWQSQYSQFMAPYHGVYHFSFKMRAVNSETKQLVLVMRSELGAVKVAVKKDTSKFWSGNFTSGENNISMCFDIELNAGDAVWVVAGNNVSGSSSCDGSPDTYFFTGQLITLIQ